MWVYINIDLKRRCEEFVEKIKNKLLDSLSFLLKVIYLFNFINYYKNRKEKKNNLLMKINQGIGNVKIYWKYVH